MVHYSIDDSFHSIRYKYGGDITKGDSVIPEVFYEFVCMLS